jgi:hypothetical protein
LRNPLLEDGVGGGEPLALRRSGGGNCDLGWRHRFVYLSHTFMSREDKLQT